MLLTDIPLLAGTELNPIKDVPDSISHRRESEDSDVTAYTNEAGPPKSSTDDGADAAVHDPRFWQIAEDHLVPLKAPWLDFVAVRSEGTKLWDKDGREMLDFTSGQMSSLLGHCHPEITSTIIQTASTLDHLFSSMLSPPISRLCAALADLLPVDLSKFIFLSTGSETVECALKMAKMYTGKWEIVGFSMGYHGMSAGSAGATFVHGRHGFGPTMPGSYLLPVPDALYSPFKHADGSYDWVTELNYGWDLIDRNLAACIIEPIVSTGGMVELPEGYLEVLKMQCEKRGMLLILDEAQTGMARTGDMFAYQASTVIPDILLLSKTLGAGLPLGAVCTSPSISSVLHQKGFMYYTTHMNDPIVCAVGAKVCEIVKRDRYVDVARDMGRVFKAGLETLNSKYPFIREVRGRGLMLALHTSSPSIGAALSDQAFKLGLNCNLVPLKELGGTIRIVPPLTVTRAEIEQGLTILEKSCEWVRGHVWEK